MSTGHCTAKEEGGRDHHELAKACVEMRLGMLMALSGSLSGALLPVEQRLMFDSA